MLAMLAAFCISDINNTMVLLLTQCKVWYGKPNQAGCDDAKSLLTTTHLYLVAAPHFAEQLSKTTS